VPTAPSLHRATRQALNRLGLHPRRRLGQSFLVAPLVVERILDAADARGKVVVEIGPGLGALSDALVASASRLVLVEIDPRLSDRLRERYAAAAHVRVVSADALDVDFADLLGDAAGAVAVGNLPYSVGTQILLRLLEARRLFARLVLMLQREVAERIVAPPGSKPYGTLSVWTALYGDARIALRVPPSAFVPRPKVESAIVRIELRSEPRVSIGDPAGFRAVVRAAFGRRRKTLRGALAGMATASQIEAAGIDPTRRGETLSLAEFAAIANLLTAGAR
jgi:16S rRNA (adenine1518-N6/adenine1519-N6)-dimethyltransferase